MAIFGFKKRKDEKLETGAQSAKAVPRKLTKGAKASSGSRKVSAMTDKKVAPVKISVPAIQENASSSAASTIIRPRVTEKSGILSQGGVYTFEVGANSNKDSIKKAFVALYKVTPVRIAVINTPIKKVFVKGRRGTVSGIRKAVITVKKGEKIEFV